MARATPFKGNPLADRIRTDLAAAVSDRLTDDGYLVTASPGKGNWATIPWVAVFDRLVTTTAQEGFYVVYLFSGDMTRVHLSLNQGTTAILREVGAGRYRNVLIDTAARDGALLGASALRGLHVGPIELRATGDLAKGYEAGNIGSVCYEADEIPDDVTLGEDLERFVALYSALVDARESIGASTSESTVESKPESVLEARRVRWHKRAERSRSLAEKAKKIHGDRCQVCDLRMAEVYGEIGDGCIEAHHLVPFADLNGRPTELDPASDFAVVCANCHRMLHKGPPFSIEELREQLKGDS